MGKSIHFFNPCTVSLPLNTDGEGETDGAADWDVVERVEQPGKQQGVHTAVDWGRPGKNWKRLWLPQIPTAIFLRDISWISYWVLGL